MKALLKLRANNIMRKAFLRGLKLVWHQRIIDSNLNQASEYCAKMRLLKKPFKQLKKRMMARKLQKTL